MPVTSFAVTHQGLRRESNEDSVGDRPNLGFWLVCDGMGGHAAGEVASRVAVETIEASIEATVDAHDQYFAWPLGFDPSVGADGTRLVTAFHLANRAIDARVAGDPTLRGMATTAVALLLVQDPDPERPATSKPGGVRALLAHVGDSRAYLWRHGVLTRLTADHSWVEEQVALGALTEAEARHHPWRNVVTRALSGALDPPVDLTPLVLDPGDRVLLCTDGLTTPVNDDVIGSVMGTGARGEVEGVCHDLVDTANDAGGPDNITVVIVEVL